MRKKRADVKKQLLIATTVTVLAVSLIQLAPATLEKSSHNNWETWTHVKKLSF
jgi:hypothetical protein